MKLLIFDMDGLLVDSEKIYRAGWLYVAKQNDIPLKAADMAGWSGQSSSQTLAKLGALVGSPALVERLKDEREDYILEQLAAGNLPLKPGAKAILQLAKAENYLTALATSTFRQRADHYLAQLDFRQYFDFMTFGDEVTNVKPDPEIYLTSLRKAGVKAKDAVAFEDTFTGGLAATRADLPVILIPDQSLGAQYSTGEKAQLNILTEATSLMDVLPLLKNDFHQKA